jgi:hypothetical protein
VVGWLWCRRGGGGVVGCGFLGTWAAGTGCGGLGRCRPGVIWGWLKGPGRVLLWWWCGHCGGLLWARVELVAGPVVVAAAVVIGGGVGPVLVSTF